MIYLESLVRPSILKLAPYSSARAITSKNVSSTTENLTASIFMDANESPCAPTLSVTYKSALNRYPSPQPVALLDAFSKIYDVPAENILITRGSDEAIDILTRAVCEPTNTTVHFNAVVTDDKTVNTTDLKNDSVQDAILITPPTYGMYEVSADIQNTLTLKVPLLLDKDNWSLDLKTLKIKLQDAQTKIKILYICSPNNPTGTVFSKNQILELVEILPQYTLLVIDEAYFEFSKATNGAALMDLSPQIVILRTLSKAWGLAGLRCGVLIGNKELIAVLQKVRAPYPIPTPVVELALNALSPDGYLEMKSRVESLLKEKENLKKELLKLPQTVRVFPSETNFLLVEFTDASTVMALTHKDNIILRDRSGQISNCVRISVGTPEENEQLIQCLQQMRNL